MSFRLLLPAQLLAEMIAQARAELPNECCGLLAGRLEGEVGRVEARYALVNAAASPTEYLSDWQSMFEADRARRKGGLEFLAVYHSHPCSDPIPSRKDMDPDRNGYGDTVVHLIISLKGGEAAVRGWWLTPGAFREADWEVIGTPG
jgi:proteasome lid subunit RPN8/RPN11